MDIIERLGQAVDKQALSPLEPIDTGTLCQDALAELKRLRRIEAEARYVAQQSIDEAKAGFVGCICFECTKALRSVVFGDDLS